MKVAVFLFCYNEECLLLHTVSHYRRMIPSCDFFIHDNMSSDRSREIAIGLGCEVIEVDTGGILDGFKLRQLKNECWRGSDYDWVFVCDMDEWLCIDEASLHRESELGNTLVKTFGYDIVADSKKEDISDINPHSCSMGLRNSWEDKMVCFRPSDIIAMNYDFGAHKCQPEGKVNQGGKYLLKHMSWLGLPYRVSRHKARFERSHKMRAFGMSTHYSNDDATIGEEFKMATRSAVELKRLCPCFA